MSTNIEAALSGLVEKVRAHYGPRAGSIFRIERSQDIEDLDRSDAEIVVLIADGDWRSVDEHRTLAKFAFEALMEHDLYIRVWPIAASSWLDPSRAEHPRLVQEFRAAAQELRAAA